MKSKAAVVAILAFVIGAAVIWGIDQWLDGNKPGARGVKVVPDAFLNGLGGTLPDDKPFVIDAAGNQVAISEIKCGKTYYVFCWKRLRNETKDCANTIAWIQARAQAKECAMKRAEEVANACRKQPSCHAQIFFQYEQRDCAEYFKPDAGNAHDRWEFQLFYEVRVECFSL